MNAPVIQRLAKVIERTGLPKSTVYSSIADGTFPRQIAIGARSVGWLSTDVDEWIASKVAESRKPPTTMQGRVPKHNGKQANSMMEVGHEKGR